MKGPSLCRAKAAMFGRTRSSKPSFVTANSSIVAPPIPSWSLTPPAKKRARLIGECEANEYALGLLRDRLARAMPGGQVRHDTKDWALRQKGRESKGVKQGQRRMMRYD